MNFLASECSSDCESGWTLYLEQSFGSSNAAYEDRGTMFDGGAKSGFCDHKGKNANIEEDEYQEEAEEDEDEDEEEDLSMVSDASSGPPHFSENEGFFNYDNPCLFPVVKDAASKRNSGGKRQKMKEHRQVEDKELPSCLDDTASSPAFSFSKGNCAFTKNQGSMESVLDYSQGFSATHFEWRSAYQDRLSCMQSPLSGNQFQNDQLSNLHCLQTLTK